MGCSWTLVRIEVVTGIRHIMSLPYGDSLREWHCSGSSGAGSLQVQLASKILVQLNFNHQHDTTEKTWEES